MKPIPVNSLVASFCLLVAMMSGNGPALAARRSAEPVYLSGERKVIVIPAQFKNLAFTYSKDDFEQMLSHNGYSRGGAQGCAEEYFNAQLGGKCTVDFDVAPIVTLGHEYAYYGMNNPFGQDMRPAHAAYDACCLSDEAVDFSLYDDIVIYYAGGSPADGSADSEHLMPHNWTLTEGGLQLTLDGVKIDRYAMAPELVLDAGGKIAMAGIGIMAHEYAHTLGLVDMYDTDGAESGGVGTALLKTTSLMDRALFNSGGCLPPNFNAIELEMLGIAEAEKLNVGTYTLPPIQREKRFLRLDTPVAGEYFLFECRNEEGWDKGIGHSGLFAYHVDKSENDTGYELRAIDRWNPSSTSVNANAAHQCALLNVISASFSPVSDPAFVAWDGTPSPLCINDVKVLQDGSVSFNVTAPLVVDRKDVFQDAVILQWHDANAGGRKSFVKWKDEKGEMHIVEEDPYEGNKYSHTFEGLSPGTNYRFSLYLVENYDYLSVDVTTWPGGGYPCIYLPADGRNESGTFRYGTGLPLRILNASGVHSLEWYFNGAGIEVGSDGYYKLVSSGVLKSVIIYENGKDEVIVKNIKIE